MATPCELCVSDGGEVVARDERLRIVLVNDAAYPGFCRVIWNAHVREMSDLSAADRAYMFETVMHVERAIREVLAPDKINLASLGNVVPHLHWHVIPRWRDDAHFPQPIWAAASRPGARPGVTDEALARLRAALTRR
ncbi:MAG TPA: HIT family protein [Burkholderiaceae bacterium]|nr:HIT family protein [Burkholderiaceae bacterium]